MPQLLLACLAYLSVALPGSTLGLVIGAAGARALAPALLALGLAMGGLYALLPRRPAYGPPAHEPPPPVTPPG